MGTWGPGALENDCASDWVIDLEEKGSLDTVREALQRVLDAKEQLVEQDDACRALAACEVVAHLNGTSGLRGADLEAISAWARPWEGSDTSGLTPIAIAAIERVVSQTSEILELWDEVGGEDWHAEVEELKRRLEQR